jgi:hypothetical protein
MFERASVIQPLMEERNRIIISVTDFAITLNAELFAYTGPPLPSKVTPYALRLNCRQAVSGSERLSGQITLLLTSNDESTFLTRIAVVSCAIDRLFANQWYSVGEKYLTILLAPAHDPAPSAIKDIWITIRPSKNIYMESVNGSCLDVPSCKKDIEPVLNSLRKATHAGLSGADWRLHSPNVGPERALSENDYLRVFAGAFRAEDRRLQLFLITLKAGPRFTLCRIWPVGPRFDTVATDAEDQIFTSIDTTLKSTIIGIVGREVGYQDSLTRSRLRPFEGCTLDGVWKLVISIMPRPEFHGGRRSIELSVHAVQQIPLEETMKEVVSMTVLEGSDATRTDDTQLAEPSWEYRYLSDWNPAWCLQSLR